MFNRRIFALAALAAAMLCGTAAAADSSAPAPAASTPYPQVRVTTSMGNFVIELYPDRAPLTVADFLRYVIQGQYTQTLFHRVVPNFLIQGGGFAAADGATKPTYPPIPNESGNGLQNKRGWVGLARTDAPHSGNCQFYINVADNPDLDPLLVRWGYAVFGKVIDGMDVVDRISTVPTGAMFRFKSDSPLTPVVIEKIEVVTGTAVTAAPGSQAPLTTPPTGSEVLSPN